MYSNVVSCVTIGLIYFSANAEDPVIVLNVSSINSREFSCTYTLVNVIFGEPLQIHIKSSNFKVESAKCFSSEDEEHELKLAVLNKRNGLKMRVEHFTSESLKWVCKLRIKYPNRIVLCNFPVKHANQNTAYVFVNGVNIKDVQMKTAPAPAQYTFVDGEVADIDCTNDVGSPAQLEYYTASGELVLSTGALDVKPVNLKLKLTKASDNSYVHCITTYYGREETKLVFHLQTADTNNFLDLYVNSLKVNPQLTKSVIPPYIYRYKYKTDENNANIMCSNKYKNDWLLQTTQEINGITYSLNAYKSSEFLNLPNLHNGEVFTCSLISGINVMETIDIIFVEDNTDLYITGLPSANITEEYKPTNDSFFVKYEYRNDEILNISCTKYTTQRNMLLLWIFENKTITGELWGTSNTLFSNITFNLTRDHDKSVLRCAETSRGQILQQVSVHFTYKPLTDAILSYEVIPLRSSERPGIEPWVLAVVGFATGVIIVFVICFIYCRMRSKKKQSVDNDINYENLPSSSDSILPHPSQWEEPTYSEAIYSQVNISPLYQNNLDSLYSKPVPKINRSKKPEGEYVNTQDQTNEALGGIKGLNYVDVSFDKDVRTNRRTAAGEEAMYAEVVEFKGHSNKFNNGIDNGGYVNT